jgi:hypothetical protein
MRPNLMIARKFLGRSARFWIGARLLVSGLVLFAGMDPLRLTFAATMVIVGASVVMGVAEMYRRHERALLENLAVSRTMMFVFLAAPAILGELIISVAASLRA